MAADNIQIDYDEMARIAKQFERSAAETQQTLLRVRRQLTALQNGGWQGRGSASFMAEMDNEVVPAIDRLQATLREAQRVTIQVARDMRQAEEEASNVFKTGAAGVPGGSEFAAAIGNGSVMGGTVPGQSAAASGSFWDKLGWSFEGDAFEYDRKAAKGDRGKFDLGVKARYGIDDASVWGDLEKDGYAVAGGSAGLEFGVGTGGVSAGLAAELYAIKVKKEGVYGGDDLGVTGGAGANVLKGEGFAGLIDNSVGASIGGTLVSVEGEAGANVAGVNVGVTGEIGLKAELGFQIGQKTKVKLPFVSFGFTFGKAKRM